MVISQDRCRGTCCHKPSFNRNVAILAGIVLVAAALRLWGAGFGLPFIYHIDEPAYGVETALKLGKGIIGQPPVEPAFANMLFIEYALYYTVGRMIGFFQSTADFARSYYRDPSVLVLLSRLTSAAAAVLTVVIVYQLGKVTRRPSVGLLASWFLAIAFLHVRNSHYGVGDIVVTFWIFLSVLFAVLALQKRSLMNLYLAAATGAVAIATKWSALPVVFPVIFVMLEVNRRVGHEKVLWIRRAGSVTFATAISFLGGLGASGFQFFLKPLAYWNHISFLRSMGEQGGFLIWQVDTLAGWLFYVKILAIGLGIALLGLAAVGGTRRLVLFRYHRDHVTILLLLFPSVYCLFMGSTRHYMARYALPLLPFCCLFAAEAVEAIADWISAQWPKLRIVTMAVLIIAASIQPLSADIRHDLLLTREDTRTIAKQWIESNITEVSCTLTSCTLGSFERSLKTLILRRFQASNGQF